MSNKFYVDDCPDEYSIHQWINEQTNLKKYINTMVPEHSGTLFEFKDKNIDTKKLLDTSEQAYEEFGWYGFMNIFGEKVSRSKEYGGLSLVYNPEYVDTSIPKYAQTLGYKRNDVPNDFLLTDSDLVKKLVDANQDKIIFNIIMEKGLYAGFEYMHSIKLISSDQYISLKEKYEDKKTIGKRIIKNTYTDTWSFNHLTPVFDLPGFQELKHRIKRTVVRSRLAQMRNINSDLTAKVLNKFIWHRDDSWFFELRLNLSLDNENNNFGIEIENFGKKDFNPGSWYVWDTLTPHRPYVDRKAPGITRTNFVLAVNPWFDYVADERCWVKNEFFGEKHTIDMVINGDVVEGLNIESLQ